MPTTPIDEVVSPRSVSVSSRIRRATGSPQPGHRSCSPVCNNEGVLSPTWWRTGSSTVMSSHHSLFSHGGLDASGDDLDIEERAHPEAGVVGGDATDRPHG